MCSDCTKIIELFSDMLSLPETQVSTKLYACVCVKKRERKMIVLFKAYVCRSEKAIAVSSRF